MSPHTWCRRAHYTTLFHDVLAARQQLCEEQEMLHCVLYDVPFVERWTDQNGVVVKGTTCLIASFIATIFSNKWYFKVVTNSDVIKNIQKTKEEPRRTNFDRKRKSFLILDSEKSLFCSKICGEERKRLSEHDIGGASNEAASSSGAGRPLACANRSSLLEYPSRSVFCVLPRRFSSKRETSRCLF